MTKAIYEFEATNWKSKSITRNNVVVSLSTWKKADAARALLIAEGFECSPIRTLEADTDVQAAVHDVKRLLGSPALCLA